MYHIFVNPSSCSGKGRTVWAKTETYFKEHLIPYELHYTKKNALMRSEFEAILSKENEETIPILVIGGDGTLNQCVNGISEPERFSLSYLPAGSGNDFVRNKKLPSSLSDKLDSIIARRNEILIDIGTVTLKAANGQSICRNFLVSSGLGYDAEICHVVNTSHLKELLNKLHLGKIAYLLVGLKNLFTTEVCDMEITANGQSKTYPAVFFITALNQPYEGGGLPMAPAATDTDGRLSFLIVYDMNRLQALMMVPFLTAGRHIGKRGIHLTEGTELTVTMPFPKAIHSDGEYLGDYIKYHITLGKKIKFIY